VHYLRTLADSRALVASALASRRAVVIGASFIGLERRIVVIGTLFSGIGKTGPATADRDGQRLVTEMFAVKNVIDGGARTVAWVFAVYFAADVADRVRRFGLLGLDAGMTMREFWNLHSAWSLHSLQGCTQTREDAILWPRGFVE
jgi:hypothetical protein